MQKIKIKETTKKETKEHPNSHSRLSVAGGSGLVATSTMVSITRYSLTEMFWFHNTQPTDRWQMLQYKN